MGNIAMSMTWKDQDNPAGQAGDILGAKTTILPDETLDGKLCTVVEYTYSTTQGSMNAKAWIWKEYGLPIQVVSTDAMGQTTTMHYRNIVVGGNISDSLFQVPPGVIVTTLPTGFPGT
jgi:outer membrane lipoprotein-sorting protein